MTYTMNVRILKIAFAMVSLMAISKQSNATTVKPMSFEELMEKTALVAEVQCTDADYSQYDLTDGSPYTRYQFRIIEVFYGDYKEGENLEYFIPGGFYPDGRVGMYQGSPVYEKGEKYLIFFKQGEWTITPVTGWWHGSFKKKRIDGTVRYLTQTSLIVCDLDNKSFKASKSQRLPREFVSELWGEDATPPVSGGNVETEEQDTNEKLNVEVTSESELLSKECSNADEIGNLLDWFVQKYQEVYASKESKKDKSLHFKPKNKGKRKGISTVPYEKDGGK